MLNTQQLESNWPKIKTQVLSKWNKLSENDVERTHGKPEQLGKLVHSKYGNQEKFDSVYEKMCDSCDSTADQNAKKTTMAAGTKEQSKVESKEESQRNVDGAFKSSPRAIDDIEQDPISKKASGMEAAPAHKGMQVPTPIPARDTPTAEKVKN